MDGDSGTALSLPFSELPVPTGRGPAPAWYIPAPGGWNDTWVIMVHGSTPPGSSRCVRCRGCTASAGHITYRNDLGAPVHWTVWLTWAPPNGVTWTARVGLARGMGARHVVLYGWSMGAELIARFLALSAAAHLVATASGSERRYAAFPSAGHTLALNVDSGRYQAVVTGFLRDHRG